MFPGLDLSYTGHAQPLTTAGEELDHLSVDIDHNPFELSGIGNGKNKQSDGTINCSGTDCLFLEGNLVFDIKRSNTSSDLVQWHISTTVVGLAGFFGIRFLIK